VGRVGRFHRCGLRGQAVVHAHQPPLGASRPGAWSARHQTWDTGGMVEPHWAALEDLDDNQLEATLLEYLDAVMAGRPAHAEDALLVALPRPPQVLWLLNWLEFEVSQGSLLAYFFNIRICDAERAPPLDSASNICCRERLRESKWQPYRCAGLCFGRSVATVRGEVRRSTQDLRRPRTWERNWRG
jgi:hypothetical protein